MLMGRGARYPHVEFYLRQYYNKGDYVLEIGCGGAVYRDLFRPDCYLGTDVFNPHYQDPDDVDVYCSANAVPFKGETFDLVFSQAAIDYMPDLMEVLHETYRVLCPGGRMLVFTYNKRTLERIHRESQNPNYESHRHYSIFTENELMTWLRQVGYNVKWLSPNPQSHVVLQRFLGKISLLSWYRKQRSTWRIFLAQKPL